MSGLDPRHLEPRLSPDRARVRRHTARRVTYCRPPWWNGRPSSHLFTLCRYRKLRELRLTTELATAADYCIREFRTKVFQKS